jgi:hypothetical protein
MSDIIVDWLALIVTMTGTGTDCPTPTELPVAAMAEGTTTTIWLGETERTVAVALPKATRTGATNPPPLIFTTSPPCGLPMDGWTEPTKKGGAWPIWTLVAPELCDSWALTVAVPWLEPGKSTAVACPPRSCRVIVCKLLPTFPNSPRLVVRVTGVRSGGACPVSVRRTVTVIVLEVMVTPAVSWFGLAVTVMV